MNENINNNTLTVENEDFKITITDKGHTDLDVGNWCTLFRSALLAMTYTPNNVDDWIRDEYDPDKIDRVKEEDEFPPEYENPCMECEEDDCEGRIHEY